MCHKQDKKQYTSSFPWQLACITLYICGTAPISELPRVAHHSAFLDSGTIIIDDVDGCGNVVELGVLAWAHIPSHTHTHTLTHTHAVHIHTCTHA